MDKLAIKIKELEISDEYDERDEAFNNAISNCLFELDTQPTVDISKMETTITTTI